MTMTLPMRPSQHETDEQAVIAFLSQKPASWATQEMSREYGRDLLVTVPAAPGLVGGDDFWVQMKGSVFCPQQSITRKRTATAGGSLCSREEMPKIASKHRKCALLRFPREDKSRVNAGISHGSRESRTKTSLPAGAKWI